MSHRTYDRKLFVQILKLIRVQVTNLNRFDPLLLGRVGNLLAVLVSARHEKGVPAVILVVPANNVRRDAYMRDVISVI